MADLLFDARVRQGSFELAARLSVAAGERVAIVGPNGAGKTTLIRAIAGLGPSVEGEIRLGDRLLDGPGCAVPAHRRGVGFCFADRRLFPHLNVRDNIAFSARAAGSARSLARRNAGRWVERFGLDELADRRPAQLSSGQAQRVALARALAGEPEALCLDEPTAALDADSRAFIRGELHRHLGDVTVPTLIVTHDPVEALMLAQRIVVIEKGRIVQDAPASRIASAPATAYVARLMGLNLYAGVLSDSDGAVRLDGGGALHATNSGQPVGSRLLVSLRPSAIVVHGEEPVGLSSRNRWPGTVAAVEMLGDRVRVRVEGAPPAIVDVTPDAVSDLGLVPGRKVWMSAKATEIHAYPRP